MTTTSISLFLQKHAPKVVIKCPSPVKDKAMHRSAQLADDIGFRLLLSSMTIISNLDMEKLYGIQNCALLLDDDALQDLTDKTTILLGGITNIILTNIKECPTYGQVFSSILDKLKRLSVSFDESADRFIPGQLTEHRLECLKQCILLMAFESEFNSTVSQKDNFSILNIFSYLIDLFKQYFKQGHVYNSSFFEEQIKALTESTEESKAPKHV